MMNLSVHGAHESVHFTKKSMVKFISDFFGIATPESISALVFSLKEFTA